MPFFPQIGPAAIITQYSYEFGDAFDTLVSDSPGGARFTFPQRGAGLASFPTTPLAKFSVNYANITDAEIATLLTFFNSMKGRYGSFSFLNPGGNLVQYSELFSDASWDRSTGPITVGAAVQDPFGGTLARSLSGGGGNNRLVTPVGPASGGMSGFVFNVSAWVNARDVGTSLSIGLLDSGGTARVTTYTLPFERWVRISHTATLWDGGAFRFVLGGNSTWASSRIIYVFGPQCTPTKGENGYVGTPAGYGYYPTCRFDTDEFAVIRNGPNSNGLSLPIVAYKA